MRPSALICAELERELSGSADPATSIRARCAVGLIFTSVLGPPHRDQAHGFPARRLTEAEKHFVTAAALAVPVPV